MGKHQHRDAQRPRTRAALTGGALVLALAAAALALGTMASAPAQAREIELTADRTSATVKISIGKSEGVRVW